VTNRDFNRSLLLATMPRFDGYDRQRWEWWSQLNLQRYGRDLGPYYGDQRREPDYRSPDYPGHANERPAVAKSGCDWWMEGDERWRRVA
jgi:hypothetical protein